MKRVLIATDLSARSDRAFERASALTEKTGAELHILYVIDEDLPGCISTDLSHAAREDIAKRLSAKSKGGRAVIHAEEGQPRDTIVRKAQDFGGRRHHRRHAQNSWRRRSLCGHDTRTGGQIQRYPGSAGPGPGDRTIRTGDCRRGFLLVAQRTTEIAALVAPVADLTLVHAYHVPFKALMMRMDTEGDISKKQRDVIERPLVAEMARFVEALGPVPGRTKQTLWEGGATVVPGQEVLRNRADLLALGVHARSPAVVGRTTEIAALVAPVADLTLVHAYHVPFKALTMRMDTEGDISKKQRDVIERPLVTEMARFVEALGPVPGRTKQTLWEGGATVAPGQEVLRNRADLLALGVHARSPAVVGLLGSTATDPMSSPPLRCAACSSAPSGSSGRDARVNDMGFLNASNAKANLPQDFASSALMPMPRAPVRARTAASCNDVARGTGRS